LRIECLDERLLMHGAGCLHDTPDEALSIPNQSKVVVSDFVVGLHAVPALASKPNAAATLLLDFNGHFEDAWENSRGEFEDIETPAFNLEGLAGLFSQREQEIIRQAWAVVAEDFAPFDINVTTIEPANPDHAMVTRVAIGGHPSDWYRNDSSPSGTSSIGSFTSDVPNLGFAFSEVLIDVAANRDYTDAELALIIGNTVSHEAGHGFGLRHQS
jgi:hypothetical protein